MVNMKKTIFSGYSHVEIQGDEVLRFISVNSHVAIYEIVGFEHIPVIMEDHRSFGLDAINTLLDDERLYDFAPKFNKPSQVLITEGDRGEILIRLTETQEINPAYMLWIAIGMQDPPPEYSYVYQEIVPYQTNKKALLSVYKRPYRKAAPIIMDYLFSPSNHIPENQILERSSLGQ
jgi:hypothetical protein